MDQNTEIGVNILEALDAGDFIFLEEAFQKRSVMEITSKENWNWLHKSLLGFNKNVPPPKSVQYLIDKGININEQDIYGMTPLHYAMRSQNIDAAIVLLKSGADPNIPNIENLIPLRMCIRYPDRLDLLELMLKNGGDVHYFDGNKELLQAIKDFKGNDPDPKYRLFISKLEEYA